MKSFNCARVYRAPTGLPMQQSGRAKAPVRIISPVPAAGRLGFAIGLERPYLAISEHD
ncbi:hypothetical protein PLUA15_20182 [Pseudomonas lundensis]|uniref:Uncharacterized protein n=1 Tax=Pseudomonas lundensis TaxID=86185 RepID=A0AAX2H752_9PSED|nr:hypothetical protein PLUA15_20182 [Pseudomonas lundensis]